MPPEIATAAEASRLPGLESGLDALETRSVPRRVGSPGRRLLDAVIPPLLVMVLAVGVWHVLAGSGVRSGAAVPTPWQVAAALGQLWTDGAVQTALATSVRRGAVGFVVAVAVGTPLGLVVARVRAVRTAIGPLITGLQVLPSVAWVPAAVLWFGLTDATVYFVILAGAIPAMVNGLVSGVDQVPPRYRQVGAILGARGFRLVRHVILPAALPGYLAGLRQGWAFSWRALMAAEVIAVGGELGFGLGSMLHQARERSDQAVVIAAIILILAVGVVVELVVLGPLERRVLHRRGLIPETTR
jgi:NitT/TauT family transport system permease protein